MRIILILALLVLIIGCVTEVAEPVSEPTRNPDCFCAALYDPVCGANGKTYSNSCEAGCWNVEIAKEGEC